VIYPEYQEGLDGIFLGQGIVVFFWLHKASRDVLKVYPWGDRSKWAAALRFLRKNVKLPCQKKNIEVFARKSIKCDWIPVRKAISYSLIAFVYGFILPG